MEAFFIAIIGLLGAIIGSLSSIFTIYFQAKIKDRRDKSKLIFNASLEDYKSSLEYAKNVGPGIKVIIQPIVTNIHWYSKIFELLEKDNLSLSSIKEVVKENDEFEKYFEQFAEK
jgi:hypothetical protein